MSERSTRKRRKPAKPSRHSPNSQPEAILSSGILEVTPEVPQDDVCKNNNNEFSLLVATQNEIENYITDKRAKLLSPN